jgi:CRP-like cAMP-binding protein
MYCHELQAGEVGKEMYILEYGVAAVTTTVTTAAATATTAATVSAAAVKRATAAVVATLSTGDYCGEAALLSSSSSSSSDTISIDSDSGGSSSNSVHVRTVTAKSYCDAFALAATDFVEVSTVHITMHAAVVM